MPQGQHSNSNDASKRRREELPKNHRLHPKPSQFGGQLGIPHTQKRFLFVRPPISRPDCESGGILEHGSVSCVLKRSVLLSNRAVASEVSIGRREGSGARR
jgi:hypothetical protein